MGAAGAKQRNTRAQPSEHTPHSTHTPQIVEGALVWLENNSTPGSAPSLDGAWRLVFSTSTSQRFFQVRRAAAS